MGNDTSVMADENGDSSSKLQTQGQDHLWTLVLQRGTESSEGACTFTRRPGTGDLADLCATAVDHLLLLRHPNIIKYLDSEMSHDQIVMVTEPAVPLPLALQDANMDTAVMGWRSVASGLDFLHKKAGLSHNNLHVGCVYVNVVDSQWKIGGFEVAARLKEISPTFLSAISSVRHEKATPPEDKAAASGGKGKPAALPEAPLHSRDVWAYGHLILTVLEEAGLEAQATDSALQYIQDEMLNPDPQLRPSIAEILTQSWMNNQSTVIADFLSNLTLKPKSDKDIFFRGLAADLHSLSPGVVAEHLAPLLINPLVMAEPCARDCLWQHLLLPATPQNPRAKIFRDSSPCPLLQPDLFKAHVIPLLLDLLESREYHVRLTLLHHLRHFAPLCDQEELMGVVLPEVLVGLKESKDELVAATLHALGDLVPLLGADTVMGMPTPRRQVFTDAQPRTAPLSPNAQQVPPSSSSAGALKGPPSARKNTPPASPSRSRAKKSREERMKEMKEKREQQRLERMARSKLGHVTTSSDILADDATTPTSSVPVAPPSNPSPQYSPSISHDEVEVECLGGSGTSIDAPVKSSKVGGEGSDSEGGVSKGKWTGFGKEEEEEEDWEEWSDIEDTEQHEIQVSSSSRHFTPPVVKETARTTPATHSSSKLVLKSKKSSQESAGEGRGPEKEEGKGVGVKGRLSAQDMQRLEEQSLRANHEPDLFADMAPKIVTSSLPNPTSSKTAPPLSNSLQYQPEQSQLDNSGDWGDEDWGDSF